MKRYLIMLSMLMLSVLTSFAQQQTPAFSWAAGTPTFQPTASTLRLNGVAFKDNQNGVIVGSDGKVYRTTNGGSSWIAVANPVASMPAGMFMNRPEFDDVAFIGQNSYIAVASSGKVIKSTNGGNTWDTVYLADLRYNYKSVASHNGIVLIGGEAGKLFRSTNYGETWDQINDSDFGMFTLNDISIVDNDTMYIAASVGRIFKSTDGGLTWNVQRPEESSSSGFNAIAFKNSTHGIAVGESGKVYRTNNGGTTWTRVQNVFASTALDGVIYKNNTIIVVGQVGQAWSSKDNGATWVLNRKQGYTGRFKDIAFINNTTAFAVGMPGRAYKIDNITYEEGGNNNEEPAPAPPTLTWTASNTGMLPAADGASSEPALMSIYFLNEQVGYVGGGSGRLYKTIDAGANWNYVQYPGFRTNSGVHSIEAIHFVNESEGYATFNSNKLMKTTNGGETWDSILVSNPDNSINEISPNTIISVGNKVITAGLSGKLFISENGGPFNYNTIQQNGEANIEGSCKFGTDVYFCGQDGRILKSTDGDANTWVNSREGITDQYDDMYDIHFISETEGYVVGQYGAHYKTTNGGATWATFPLSEVGTNTLSGVDFRGNNGVIVGANGKAWVTTDGGASWTYSKPEPNATTFLYDVKFISNNVAIVVGDRQKIYKLVIGNVAEEPNLTATPAIVIFQSEATATEPLTKTVEVTANVNWVVDESIEWLMVAPTSGDANAQLTFTAELNPTINQRSGTVRVRTADNSIVREINVTQAAGSGTAPVVTLEVTPASFNFGASAGLLPVQNGSVTVTSNSAWTATVNLEWVVIPSANGNGNGNFVFTVVNNTGAQRSGVITVTAGNVTREVTITQAAGSVAPPPNPPAGNGSWVVVPSGTNNTLNDIHLHSPNLYYAVGANGKIIKSVTKGLTWTNVTNNVANNQSLSSVFFTSPEVGYVGGILRTISKTNGNENTWTTQEVGSGRYGSINDIYFKDAQNGYACGAWGNYLKTNDYGATWTRVNLPNGVNGNYENTLTKIKFSSSQVGLMTGYLGAIFRTEDGGATWSKMQSPAGSQYIQLRGLDINSQGVAIVVGNAGHVLRSTNGTQWTRLQGQSIPTNLGNKHVISVAFANDNLVFAGCQGGYMMKSEDAGANWTEVQSGTNKDIQEIDFDSEGTGIAVCKDGVVLRYTGNATPAPTLTVDPANMQFAATAVAPLTAQQQPVTITTNNNWNATVSQGAESWLSVLPGNGTSAVGAAAVIAQNNTGAARTGTVTINAGGLTQTITVNQAGVANPPALDPIGTWVNVPMNVTTLPLYSVFPVNESTLYTVSAYDGDDSEGSTYIIKSENAGNTWTSTAQFGEDEQIDLKDICFRNATSAYIVGTDGAILKKSNNGWLSIFIRGLGFTQLNAVKFPTENTGYIVGDKDGTQSRVYKTIDGETWARLTSAPLFNYIDLYFVTDELGFMVGERIVKTIDGGTTWTTYNLLPTETNNDLTGVYFTSAQVGYVVGNGGKAYKTSNGGTTWEAMTLPELDNADLKSVYFVNATEGYIVGHGGRIYQTRNGGTTWARQTSGINTILYKVRFLNENVGYAVGASGRVLKFVRNTPTPTLAVDRNEVNFQAANATNPLDQQTTTITVTSNRAWTVTENIEWLSVNPENGTNNGTFVISVLPNTGDQRTGTVTVTAGTLTQTITVNQAAGTPTTNLVVNPASINFAVSPAPGSGEIVNVTSNTNWTVTASLDWISVFPTAGNNNGMFMVSATANTGAERTGNITVSGGGVTRTITVTQAGTTPPSPTNPSIVWELKNNGTSDISTLYGVSFPTSRVGYAVGTSGRVYKTINRGDQWSEVVRPTTTSISGVYFYDAEIGVVVSDNRILRTTSGGTSWTPFTPQGTDLVFNGVNGHGQTIIAVGGNGLIMRTTDGGETWNRVNSQAVAVNTLSRVVFATEDTVFIAGARGRVFKSVDGGINWSSANTGISSLGILRDIYFKDGRNGIVVGQSGTKFKTSNGGTSWQQISITAGGDLLAAAGKGDVYIFTNNGGGSFVSFDNRETWGRYNFQSGFTQRINDLDFADANTVFAVGSGGKVYRGTISGITPPAPTPTLTVNPTAVNFNATTTTAAPLTQTITVTANNPWTVSIPTTANWLTATPANGSAPLPGFALTAQPNTGAERAATVTVNSGNLSRTITVTQAGTPAPPAVLVVVPQAVSFDASAVIGTQTRSVAVTSNNDWTVSIPAGDASWLSAEPAQGTANNTLLTLRATNNDGSEARTSTITVTAGGVSRTIAVTQTADLATPTSVTWTRHTNVPAPAGTTGRATLFAVATPASDKALVGGQYGNLYKTDNTGTDWSKLEASANPYTGTIQAMAFADSQKGYAVGSNGKVMKTTNGGAGWSMVTPDPAVKALWAVATKGSIVLASGYNAGTTNDGFNMRRSENSGADWSKFTVPAIGTMGITDIQFVTDSLVFASGEEKVFKSYDAGKTWTNISNGIDLSNQDPRYRKLQDIYFIDALNGYVVGNLNTAYKTTDGGANWTQVNQFDVPGQGRLDLQSISFFGKTGIITGSESAAWTTTDGGETWAFQKTDNTSDWHVNDVAFYDYKTAVAAGHDTRIYKATFSRVSAPPTLTVSSENVRLFGTQLTQTITVESNADWTVADDADWMRVIKNPLNDNELVISLIPNLNITEDKIGTVVVTANNGRNIAVKNITVTMPVPTALTVNPKTVNFAAASATALPQSETITVASNASWTVSVPQTATWLTVNPAAGTAPGTFAITAQNNTGEQRTADITVTAGTGNNTKTETIRVTQAAGVVTPTPAQGTWTAHEISGGQNDVYALSPSTAVAGGGWNQNISRTTTSGDAWTTTSSGSVMSIDFANSQIGFAAGRSGNIKKTTDGGETWQNANTGITGSPFFWTIDFVNDQVGYVGGNDGAIYKTTDGGAQWTPITAPVANGRIYSLFFVTPNIGYAALQNSGVYKTIDGGERWQRITSFPQVTTRALHFFDEQTGYVTYNTFTERGIKKTTNGGETWEEMQIPQIPGQVTYIGIHFPTPQVGYACGWQGGIVKTRDGGATWQRDTLFVNGQRYTGTLEGIHFADENNGYCVGSGKVFKYTGASTPPAPTPTVLWTRITEGIERQGTGTLAALQTVSAPTDQVAYAAGTRGKLFKTTTGGTSWTEFRNNPIAAMAPTAEIRSLYFTDAQTGYVVGYNGNVMRTVDGGANWIVVNPAPSPRMLWAVGAYGNSIIASGYNGDTDNVGNIRRSTDGGVTWETITSEVIGTNGVTGIHFVNANLVMASGQSGKVYKSVDGGATWAFSNTGITSTRTLNHIYFKDPKNGYVVGDRSYAYKTTDGGDTWTPVDQFQVNNGNRNLLGVAMHGRAGVIVGASGTAWTTTDGGATWVYQKPEEEFTLSINKVDFFDYQTAIAAGHDLRVFRANFSGLTPPPALTLSQETMELPATAAPQTVTVTTPSTWTTYADVDWLTVVPDGQTLTVTALPNTGSARRGVVTVLAGTDGNTTVKYITVNQDSPAVAPELAVTPEIVQFEDAAGAQTITVTSNANWTVTETAPWIDITTPNGTNNGTFTINATANTNATARNAVVTVTAGTITNPTVKTITVNQAGATIVNPSVPGQWVEMENDVIYGDLRTVFAINANKVQTAGVNAESMFGPADANLIYSSADKGESFVDAEPIEDWTETINDLFFVTDDTGFAVTEDGQVLKTRDGGINWQNREVSQSALKAVRFVSESLGYAVGNDGKLYKTNDASDWTEVPTGTAINFKSAYFVNANCGYLVGNGIVRYNSDDNITVQRDDNTMLHGVYFFNENKGFAVGENSTVLKTINGGLRWDLVTIEGLPTDVTLRSIYFADADNGHIVGDGGRIYKTSNGGRTWVLEASTTTEDLYSVHFFDTETGYAVGDGPKFLRYIAPVPPAPPAPPTAQEGWNVVNAGPEVSFTEYTAIKFADANNGIAVGVGNRIAKTTDGGLTWTNPQIPEMTGYGLFNLRYVGNTIQLADNQGRIFRSDDNGQNWNTIGTAEPYWFNNVCFINEQTIIGGSVGRVDRVTPIRRTTNGGTSWTDPIANPGLGQCNDFDFVTEQIGWAVGNSATVMKTTDGGLTWTSQNPNIPTNTVFLDDYSNNGQLGGIIDVDFVDEQTGYICGFDGKILKSTDGGASWVEQNSGTQVALRGIFAINADLVYAVGDGGTILKTNNGGSTWTREVSNTTKNLHEVYFLDENNGYAVGDDRTIVKYHHTPIEWVALSSGVENANASLNDVHFLNDRVGYIVGSNGVGLRKTNDAGVNWTKITTNFDNNNTNKVFFVDEVNGFVAPSNDLLKHTTSSGENWDSYAGSPLGATDIYAFNENIAYATHTNGRIYRLKRTPNENTWYGTVGGPDDQTLGSSGGSKALHLVNSNIGYALVFNGSNDFILKGTRLSETSGAVQDVWSDPSSGTMFFPRGSMNDIYFVNENLGFVVGNNGAVKMTNNGGVQWSNVSVATVANLNKLYFRTATEGYIVGDNGTILRTEDGGSTWRIDPTGVTANLKSVHSANGMNVIYVVGENNTLLRRGTPALLPELAVNPEAHTFAALATANEPLTKTIEVTCNVDWTVTKNVEWLSVQPASGSNNGTFTITAQEHFVRNQRTGVVTVSAGGITKKITITQEAGEPQLVNGWNVITTDPNAQGGYGGWGAQFTHIAFKDRENGYAIGPNGKVAKTTDGGITWTISDFPVANVAFYGLSYTNNSLRLAQNSNIIRKSLTNGNTWEQPIGTVPTDWSYFDQVYFVNEGLVIGSTWGGTPGDGPQKVKRSTDGGESWEVIPTNGFAEVLKFDFINDRTGWGVGYKGTVVKTTDAGRTWTEQATPLPRNTTNDHISCLMGVDFVDENIGYAAGYDGKILKTTNGGEEWLPLNSGTTKHLYDIKAFNADLVLAVGETGTILRSNDGGISWTAEASNTTEDLQEVHFLDDKNAVAVGNKRTILRYKVRELATLNINPSTVRLQSPANSTNTITLEANRTWTATASDWIQLSSVAGIPGSFTIEVKARTVNGLVSQRVGIITFEAGEGVSKVVKSVRVIQEGGVSTISINKDSETVQSSGGIIDIEVTSNDNWIVEDNVDWAYATPESGAQNGSVNITVVPNTENNSRTATFTFKTINGVSKKFTITQGAAGTKLVVEKNLIQASSGNSTHPVRISSNINWTATPSTNWIRVVPGNGNGNGVINIIVNENSSTDVREGKVTVSGGGIVKEISVYQNGKAVAVNWVVVPNTVDNDFTSVMMPSQNTAYITGWSIYGGTSGEPAKVVKTTDYGDTWNNFTPDMSMTGGFGYNSIYFTDDNNGHIAGFSSKYGKTQNAGTGWSVIAVPGPSYQQWGNIYYSVDFPTNSIGYMVGADWTIYKTTDAGETWTRKYDSQGRGALRCVDFVNDQIGYAVGDKKTILKTVDGGDTWTTLSNDQDGSVLHGVHFINERVGYVVGYEGTYGKTVDGGDTWSWTDGLNGYNNLYLYSVKFVNSDKGYIVGGNGKIFKTENGGQLWEEEPSITTNTLMSVSFFDENHGFAVGKRGTILKYVPDGANLAVSPATVNAPAKGMQQSITVTSNGAWTVESKETWIKTSVTNGYNNGNVNLTILPNPTIETRVGTVTFKLGNIETSVIVTQSGLVPDITITPSSLVTLGAIERRTQEIKVKSNVKWEVRNIKEEDTWLTVTPMKGNSGETIVTITAAQYDGTKARSTSFDIGAGSTNKTITITQNGVETSDMVLQVNPKELIFEHIKGINALQVTSNQEWTVERTAEWITIDKEAGINNQSLVVSVEANESIFDRVGMLIFKTKNNQKFESVLVTQKGKHTGVYFEVTPEYITLEAANNSSGSITITTNQAWTASDDADWLSISKDEGNGDAKINVVARENTATEERTATVTLQSGATTKTVVVTQLAAEMVLTVNPETLEFTHEKGSKEVSIESNTKWTLSTESQWITFTQNEGDGNGNFNVEVEENTANEERTGTVKVAYANGKEKVINVKQAAAPASVEVASDDMFIYPNPTEDVLFIKHTNTIKSVKVIDARGKAVISIDKLSVNSVYMKDLTAGTYTVVIVDVQGNKISKKITKL